MSWILPSSIFLCVALGLLSPVLRSMFRQHLGRALSVVPFVLFSIFLSFIPRVSRGETLSTSVSWIRIPLERLGLQDSFGSSTLDINFAFALDGLSLLFTLIITGMGALVLFYAASYLSETEDHTKFFTYLMLFIGAMLGVVLADNTILLYLFWEMTSITSFLLIGFWSHRDASRSGALKALLVTAAGGLAMLAGIVMMLVVTNTVDLPTLLTNSDIVKSSVLYPAMAILILLGAFTKSAQVPFHLWLPNAMEAPTPVSAYLHSAAMVKAGIYLIARMSGVLGGTTLWVLLVAGIGIVSLVLGSYLALRQTDLKAILAFSTISQLGLIVTLFGWGTPLAVAAGIFHTLNHSVFKAALFMMVGIVDVQTGTRDVRRLRRLGKAMPVTAAIAMIASFALAGVPPFNGFISKEMFFTASVELQELFSHTPAIGSFLTVLFPVLAVVGSALTFIYSLVISHRVFYANEDAPSTEVLETSPQDPHPLFWLPPVLLAGLALLFGVWPGLVSRSLILPAATSVFRSPVTTHISLWHGVNLPLAMSLFVIVLGFVAYRYVDHVRNLLLRLPTRLNVNAIYDWALDALVRFAEFVERRLLTGFSRDYFAYLLGFFLAIFGFALLRTGAFPVQMSWTPIGSLDWSELLFAVLALVTTLSLPFFRTRVSLVVALGAVGTSLVMLWTLFRAPDLSLTMLVVETASLLLFLLIFSYLPRLRQDRFPRMARSLNLILSAATGLVITWLMLGAQGIRLTRPLADWYLEHSESLANGTNVVNVILVDFRGFDTLFEITVLALAGIGVYILSNMRFKGGSK